MVKLVQHGNAVHLDKFTRRKFTRQFFCKLIGTEHLGGNGIRKVCHRKNQNGFFVVLKLPDFQ